MCLAGALVLVREGRCVHACAHCSAPAAGQQLCLVYRAWEHPFEHG